MFNKKKPNLETIQDLKNYFIKKYEIPESTILSIAELNCHEPDCPPTETVVTARSIAVSYTHLTLPTKRIV